MKQGLGIGLDKQSKRGNNTLLLDDFSGATAAYSLRYLTNDYTGDVILVRRSSDNAEEGFTPSEITDGTLLSFCGAGDGFIRTWYSQIGAKNLNQSVTSKQPIIVEAGVLMTKNSLPAIKAVGVEDQLISDSSFTVGSGLTLFCVYANDSTSGTNRGVFGKWGGTQNEYALLARHYAGTPFRVSLLTTNGSTSKVSISSLYLDTPQINLFTTIFTQSNNILYQNETELINVSVAAVNNSDGIFTLFSYSNAGSLNDPNSHVSELIIFNSDQSVNRNAIETEINSYYSIY